MSVVKTFHLHDKIFLTKDIDILLDGDYITIPSGTVGYVLIEPKANNKTLLCEFIKDLPTGEPYTVCGIPVFPSDVSLISVKEPIAS
jgi:hypothetical protein